MNYQSNLMKRRESDSFSWLCIKEVAYYQQEFMALGETHFATDDGSFGAHGNVGRLLSEALAKGRIPDAVYACGANGMLKAIDSLFPTSTFTFL